MIKTRGVIGTLSALGGGAAATVGAVSLTRLAGHQLGFPPGLPWTFTAAVDIGALAGAIMWSTSQPRTSTRRTGVQLNVACSTISAIGVGLDHSVHAALGWALPAFLIGAFLPLLSTWLVHGLAKMSRSVPVEQPVEVIEQVVVEVVEPAPVVEVVEPEPEPSSLPERGAVKAVVREEWMRQAREVLARGEGLDTIVLAQVDLQAGASKGYAKKHVATWRAELEAVS